MAPPLLKVCVWGGGGGGGGGAVAPPAPPFSYATLSVCVRARARWLVIVGGFIKLTL